MNMITSTSDHIEVEGHIGTWYVIDEGRFSANCTEDKAAKTMFLLEHETYGDEAACIIVDEDGNLILEDVWNGFEDLEDAGWEKNET